MNKRLILGLTICIMTFFLTACSENNVSDAAEDKAEGSEALENAGEESDNHNSDSSNQNNTDKFDPVDISAGGWKIEIQNYMREASMKNAATVLGYTDTTTTEYVQEAPEGKEYFLIKLELTKENSKEDIEWERLILTDQNNLVYSRVEDIFIEDLGMKRIPGTDLNFGSNEGWIAFEINKESKDLKLQYQFENDTMEYKFHEGD